MGDLISRQAAIDEIKALYEWHEIVTEDRAIDHFKRLPSAEPERKRGKWIAHPGGKFVGFPYMHYECDQCRDFEPEERNFCPNCGADMRGEEDG